MSFSDVSFLISHGYGLSRRARIACPVPMPATEDRVYVPLSFLQNRLIFPSGSSFSLFLSLQQLPVLAQENTSQGHCPAVISFQNPFTPCQITLEWSAQPPRRFPTCCLRKYFRPTTNQTLSGPPVVPLSFPCRSLPHWYWYLHAIDPGSGTLASVGAGVNRDCSPFCTFMRSTVAMIHFKPFPSSTSLASIQILPPFQLSSKVCCRHGF